MNARVPMFSVIVPTLDRPRYLQEALDSVLRQTVQDFEIIVVDDGSQVPAAVPRDPRIRLIRHRERRGLAAARNTGLAHARGRFVCFLDDDDLYVPERLEVVAPHLERAPLVVVWARYSDGSGAPGRFLEGDVHDVILDATTPPLGAVTAQREVVARFDESYLASQDLEWWLRQTRVCRVATVPHHGYLVRRHGGPRDGWGMEARIEHQLRLLEQYRTYFEQHPRARAFRWRRIGLMRLALGDTPGARAAFAASFAARPSARAVWHFLRTLRPARGAAGRKAVRDGPRPPSSAPSQRRPWTSPS